MKMVNRCLRTGRSRHRRSSRAAFSLTEVVVSSAIVSVLLVAALQTVAAAGQNRAVMQRRLVARQLTQGLMAEILTKPFADPEGGFGIGPDLGEIASLRSTFDDLDDYHGWSAAPPESADGTALGDYAGWGRSVQVRYVDFASGVPFTPMSSSDFKAITVSVSYEGDQVLSITAIRADYEAE